MVGNKKELIKGVTLGVVSAILWGTYAPFLKLMFDYGLSDYTITTLAPFVIVVGLGIIMVVKDKSTFQVSWKMLTILAIHGIILMNGMNYTYVQAVTRIPVAIVSILAYCNVILLIIMERALKNIKISKIKVVSTLIAVIGVGFVLQVFAITTNSLNMSGVLWALTNTVILSIAYFLISHVYYPSGVSWQAQLFYPNLFGMLFLFGTVSSPTQMAVNILEAASSNGSIVFLIILGFALLPQIISFSMQMMSFKHIPAPYVSMIFSLEPITGLVIGLIIWNQTLDFGQMFGIILAIGSIFYMYFAESKQIQVQKT